MVRRYFGADLPAMWGGREREKSTGQFSHTCTNVTHSHTHSCQLPQHTPTQSCGDSLSVSHGPEHLRYFLQERFSQTVVAVSEMFSSWLAAPHDL